MVETLEWIKANQLFTFGLGTLVVWAIVIIVRAAKES